MQIKGQKFLVVGGAGFVGSHVVDQLLEAGAAQVRVYDNFARGRIENLAGALRDPRCEVFPDGGDILHRDTLTAAMNGMDGVFHLAAVWLLQCHQYPDTAFRVNVEGTFNVIQASIAAGIKKVVFSSSASVYGDAVCIPMVEAHPYNNQTFYGATKIAGEHFFKSLGARYKLPWVGLRYMNVYGPRQDYLGAYIAVMHKILDRIEQGQSPILFGDGSQCYDFIAVEDVARANVLAMASDAHGNNYNIGRGIGTSLKELCTILLSLKQSQLPIQYEPAGLTFVTNRIGCPKAAEKDLGFSWQIPLEEGLARLIEWRDTHREAVLERSLQLSRRETSAPQVSGSRLHKVA